MSLDLFQFPGNALEFVYQFRDLFVYIIIGILVRLRSGNHHDLPVIGVQIQDNGIQLTHGVTDLARDDLHGDGVFFPCCEVDIHILAVPVLDGGHAEVGVVVELHLIEFLAGNCAVNINAAVGVKTTHFFLACLDAQLIPAVSRQCVCIHLPGDGLERLFPVAAADGVVHHVFRVRGRDGAGGIVIGRIQHGI